MELIETLECPGYVIEQYRTVTGMYFRCFERIAGSLVFAADWYSETVKAKAS